jgi:LPS-assembly protein
LKKIFSFPVELCVLVACATASAWAQEGFERLPEPTLPTPKSTQEGDQPVTGTAKSITGQQDQRTLMQGEADLQRANTRLRADEIEYFHVEDEVHARGRVRLERERDILLTPELRMKLDTYEGFARKPEVYYGTVGGRGKGERIEFLGRGQQRLTDTEYTTCKPGDDSWILRAELLELDQANSTGVARGASVEFKGLPILGTPYLSFPLGNERRSGFLPPSLGLTTTTGIDVTVPYYWDIAPNRDLTIEPRIMTKRGLLLGGNFRYLEPTYKGEVKGEWLGTDQQTKQTRGSFNAQHTWGNGPWAAGWNVQYASDDTYFSDLAKSVATVATTFLPREAWLTYGQTFWNASARVSSAQNLFDAKAALRAMAYERVPQLTWSYLQPGLRGFDLGMTADLTQFQYPSLRDGRFLAAPIDVDKGQRLVLNPSVSYPLIAPGYFVTPRLSLHATQYSNIRGGPGGPGAAPYAGPESHSRVLPLASLDSGLIFERDDGLFAPHLKQTLEPRLYYLYVPYKDQSLLPNFDSALTNFGFAQLFSENVFAGNDRIADANHLTFALTTRYIAPDTGEERLRLAIGKRQYFTPQRVDLPGAVISTGRSSDLLVSASGALVNSWSFDSTVQVNSDTNRTTRSAIGVRYNPAPRNILNVAYRFNQDVNDPVEQWDASAQWKLGGRWYGVGRVNYSAREKRLAEALLGVEYDANCWVARIVASRFSTATQTATTALFFQLELMGLGSLGTDPLDTIRRNVPGYRKLEAPQPWTYDPY